VVQSCLTLAVRLDDEVFRILQSGKIDALADECAEHKAA
jgi:hypothetical protein